jgi:hypothetical protein
MCRCVSSELLLDSRPPLFLRPVLCSSCCYVGIINPFFFSFFLFFFHVFCNSFCFSLLVCCGSYSPSSLAIRSFSRDFCNCISVGPSLFSSLDFRLCQCIFGFSLFLEVVVGSKWMFKYVRLNLCIICFCNYLVRLLERTVPFFGPISYALFIFSHFCFGSIVWEPTHFPFVGSSTLSFFWIMSENDHPMSSPFLIQLGKKKKSFVVRDKNILVVLGRVLRDGNV